MPVGRFALYFFGLAVCSTIAFASEQTGQIVTNDDTAAFEAASAPAIFPAGRAALNRHRPRPKPAQLARVD